MKAVGEKEDVEYYLMTFECIAFMNQTAEKE